MSGSECPREVEVGRAVLAGQWPLLGDDDLRAHVDACGICQDVVAVASVMSSERARGRDDMTVPAAAQIWWRAAIRARLEATEAAARPMIWAHGITAACGVGLAAAGGAAAWPLVSRLGEWASARAPDTSVVAADVTELVSVAVQRGLPFVVAAAVCLVAAPIALYWALHDE